MFAFALWDRNRETLFLARDRLGVKPLYYALLAERPARLRLRAEVADGAPGVQARSRPVRHRGVFRARLRSRAAHRSTQARASFRPAHTLTIRRGQPVPEPREYWDVRFTLDNPIGERDAEAELIERLRESIRLRMIAEVPLGAFLSGGVDSSAVVAMMAGVSAEPVNTCSISFGDPAFDESRFAQAGRRPLPHAPLRRHGRKRRFRPDRRARADLRRAVRGQLGDADLSRLPARAQARDRRAVRATAATRTSPATGAIGCTRWRSACAARCRSRVRRPAFGLLGRMYPKADWAPRMFRAKSTFQALARTSVDAYFHSVSILRDDMRHQLYSNAFKARLGRLFGGRGLPPPWPRAPERTIRSRSSSTSI